MRISGALTATGALAVCLSATAVAQTSRQGGDIDLQAFRPAMDSRGFITVDASQVLGHGELSFGLVTSWGRNILRFERGLDTYEVQNILTPALVGAVGLRVGRLELELGAAAPFVIVSGDRGPDDSGGEPPNPNQARNFHFDGQGLGDVSVHAKLRLLATSQAPHIGLALIASARLPTASQARSWTGGAGIAPQIAIAVDREWYRGRVRGAVNIGYRHRSQPTSFVDDAAAQLMDPAIPMTGGRIELGSSIPFGIGASYALVPKHFDLVAELFGEVPLEGENYQPLEAIAGAKLYLARNSYLTLGGGTGLVSSAGANPDVRAFLGIVFEPSLGDRDGDGLKDDVDRCPDDPEDYDEFEDDNGCPDLDNDSDGLLDIDDACPNVPEDRDGYEDDDGCPETETLDRDGDRIFDDVDRCPDDPEDYDDFQDDDGCPDVDNDEDGILDVDDLCPNDPEDYDRFEDRDGCPDLDNDRDRILDVDDECPNEPENYNGYRDEDGCPDPDVVREVDGELILLERIYFEYDKAIIKPESFPVLDALGYTLRSNPGIALVEVQGHTDERGSDEYNLDLSERRAQAVVQYLIDYGIESGRLEPRGYGESAPRVTGHNQRAWAANRRVQFLIIRRTDD